MPDMVPVESSHIAAVGYDPSTQQMHMQFKNGGGGYHANVPPEKHAAFMASNSKGQHYHQNFRSNADHPWTKAA